MSSAGKAAVHFGVYGPAKAELSIVLSGLRSSFVLEELPLSRRPEQLCDCLRIAAGPARRPAVFP